LLPDFEPDFLVSLRTPKTHQNKVKTEYSFKKLSPASENILNSAGDQADIQMR
jgi:hypothetical protein